MHQARASITLHFSHLYLNYPEEKFCKIINDNKNEKFTLILKIIGPLLLDHPKESYDPVTIIRLYPSNILTPFAETNTFLGLSSDTLKCVLNYTPYCFILGCLSYTSCSTFLLHSFVHFTYLRYLFTFASTSKIIFSEKMPSQFDFINLW